MNIKHLTVEELERYLWVTNNANYKEFEQLFDMVFDAEDLMEQYDYDGD